MRINVERRKMLVEVIGKAAMLEHTEGGKKICLIS